jgi:putative serine protease PepD
VVAIGSPLGLDSTVTSGIISALNRPVVTGQNQPTAFINAIQTDAAINPGNSGGPLVGLDGRVVGVNSAIARAPGLTSTAGNIGLGFAIPSNQAHRTAQQLIDDGKATHPVIGVLLSRDDSRDGAHVSTEKNPNGEAPVTKNGPADKAGIEPGDVVVAFDGRPIASSDELIVAIRSRVPGETVTVRVLRNGKKHDLKVTLEAGD